MTTATDSGVLQPATGALGAANRLRGFWSLFVAQFENAFSDNVLRFLVALLIVSMGFSAERRKLLEALVFGLFALPFVLFSMAGGFLADRFSKRNVVIGVKLAEVGAMSVALVGFGRNIVWLWLVAIFVMSIQSAVFGPSKYGLLPELLSQKRLSWGNGIIGLGTYVAGISGIVAAGLLMRAFGRNQAWSGALLVGLAMFGVLMSLGISRLPAAAPTKKFRANFLGDLVGQLRIIRRDRVLFLAVLGNCCLSFLAALLLPATLDYAKDVLHVEEHSLSFVFLWTALAVGIGGGSVAAGYLSGNKIEYGLVPFGALGMAICCAALGKPSLTYAAVVALLALLTFASGFFRVPIDALIQHRPEPDNKGGVIAASAFLSWVAILLASGSYLLLANVARLTPPQTFLVGAFLTMAGAVYLVGLLPDSLLRLALWALTRTLYRIRVQGRDNIPDKGGALFVCNHVSFVDALLLIAATDRQVRFLMFKGTYELPYVKPFARILGIIPISSEQRPREMIQSLRTASRAIKEGHIVCIFAEGQITRTGQLLPFRRGVERVMHDVDAPIVPVALDGVWGSIFSFEKRRFVWKFPRHLPYPVTVSFGVPLSARSTAFEVRLAVQELMASAWHHRRERMQTLPRAFVRQARRHPFRFAMADAQNRRVRFGPALVRTVLLARRLKRVWAGQQRIGLLFPPSVPGALVNFAVLLTGRVPVNLNYTLTGQTLASCIQQCGIKTIVTSRAFLEKTKLRMPGEVVLVEDLAARPGVAEKAVAALMAGLLPVGWLERALGRGRKMELDDLATVIFSSGSTGDPKGILLSHYNIGSNLEQMGQVFGLTPRDRMLGILPFFHSFGFTATLCLPAVLGVGVVYHANPLDAKTLGPLVSRYEVTFLLATPTFLQLYLRGCAPGDFGSLRVVMAGGEKLPERLATAFEERFGIRPLEGYGCTECAPAVAVSTHDFRSAGFRQIGAKRGRIGHPLPGVCVRVADVATLEPLPAGQPGMLLVRGPNVMQGYLGRPDKTAEVIRDGWYVTGDVAVLDEDGFLQITDRLSRFSKIGGEMVPHLMVEDKLHELAGVTEQTFAVTGLADANKGERLIVLHTLKAEELPPLVAKLGQSGLPNLWKPRADGFFRVDALPHLGSGKLDLHKVREIAQERAAKAAETPV